MPARTAMFNMPTFAGPTIFAAVHIRFKSPNFIIKVLKTAKIHTFTTNYKIHSRRITF